MSDLTEMERAADREAEAARLASGWMPIDTAPEDGRTLNVWVFGWPVVPALYSSEGRGFNEDLPGWYAPVEDVWIEPTHWMPLPAPPGEIA